MGNALLLFIIGRPQRLIERSKVTQTASRTLPENSRMKRLPGDTTANALTQVRHDIDSSVDFAVFAGDKLFGLKGGI